MTSTSKASIGLDLVSGLDYSRFKFSSEVDFLMLNLQLRAATNAWSVQKALKVTYVKALDDGPGGAATRFRVRVDDPKTWRSVREIIAIAESSFGVVGTPSISTIEVTFDGYSRDEDHASLASLAARFFQMGPIESENVRLTGPRGTVIAGPAFLAPDQTFRKLQAGRVIQAGNVDDPIRQRIYVKTTDRAGSVVLPTERHRARIEVTLTAPACPVSDSNGWSAFKFQALSNRFRFRKASQAVVSGPALGKVVLAATTMLGTRQARPGRRLYNNQTSADTDLNRRAYDALRDLTRRMNA